VDPLVITRGLGEPVDAHLRHLDPGAVANVLCHCGSQVFAASEYSHGCPFGC
jgi:hypothetical protein